jgi:hypothetical protein
MATKLTKPVSRLDERDNLIITLAPEGVYVREKGRRTVYGPLSYGALKLRCAMVNAEATRKERKTRRVSRNLLKLGT